MGITCRRLVNYLSNSCYVTNCIHSVHLGYTQREPIIFTKQRNKSEYCVMGAVCALHGHTGCQHNSVRNTKSNKTSLLKIPLPYQHYLCAQWPFLPHE